MPSKRDDDPALVFEHPTTDAGTHVLIIGIGDYPHLLDGSNEDVTVAEGMGQLKSPPASARVLANWFLDNFNNPEKPLASLALVISEPAPARYSHPKATRSGDDLPRGTIDEIAEAVSRWVDRASTNIENQTIFFFAGHGLSSAETLLLTRDFGGRRHNRFDGSFNFNDFAGSLQTFTPNFQLFLIDACRVPTTLANWAARQPALGRPLLAQADPALRGGNVAMQSVHHATSPLTPAYGRLDGISLYTEALLRALGGGGAQPDMKWWVGTNGLEAALSAYTERLAANEGVKQLPERLRVARFKIHKPQKIEVPVYVACIPPEAWREKLRLEINPGTEEGPKVYDHDPHAVAGFREWEAVVDRREHRIAATFGSGSRFKNTTDTLMAVPPETPIDLTVGDV